MSDSSLSSADMLICNLPDHQVIRIEGRPAWMNRISERLVDTYPDSLVLDQAVTLASAQTALAELLNVINDASFIQQALKAWLEQDRTLLLVINPNTVESNALTYLLGLPSICNEHRSAVTIVLVSTPALLTELKANNALASKLDGYYQEEADEDAVVESKGMLKFVAAAAGVACLCAGAWYLYQTSEQPTPITDALITDGAATENTATDSVTTGNSATESAANEPQFAVDNTEAASTPTQPITEDEESFVSEQSTETDAKQLVQSEESVKTDFDQQLLADLSATIDQVRSAQAASAEKKQQTAIADRQAEKAELAERYQAAAETEEQSLLQQAQSFVADLVNPEPVEDRTAEKTELAERFAAEQAAAIEAEKKKAAIAAAKQKAAQEAAQRKAELAQQLAAEKAAEKAAAIEEAKKKAAIAEARKQAQKQAEEAVKQRAAAAAKAAEKQRLQAAIAAAKPSGPALEVAQAKTVAEPISDDREQQRQALVAGIDAGALEPKIVPKTAPKPASEFKPQAKPKAVKRKPVDHEKAVRKVFDTWRTAWAGQDWDAYIGSYLQNTIPYGVKMSLQEWRAFRKERLLKPEWIKLTLGEPILTRLDSHWYRIEFYQRFEKPGYADETTKRLELTLTSDGWRIASEAANGTIVLKRPGG